MCKVGDIFVICTDLDIRTVKVAKMGNRIKVHEVGLTQLAAKCVVGIDSKHILVALDNIEHLKILRIDTLNEVERIQNAHCANYSYFNLKVVKEGILMKERARISLVDVAGKTVTPLIESNFNKLMKRPYSMEVDERN